MIVHAEQMYTNSNLILTVRFNGQLIGIARSLTDFGFVAILSDLAVRKEFQSIAELENNW